MKLNELTKALKDVVTHGPSNVEIAGIATDSRSVRSGDVFVAIRGTTSDGHDFIGDAISRGAIAIVTDTRYRATGIANVVVADTAKALAAISSSFFGHPAAALFLCGITGTNGKTTTAHMYRSIVETSGWGKTGIVGTLGHGSGSELEKTQHTTPGPVELHRRFKEMANAGCRGVVMEVSSHAVRQHRTWGLDFDIGILTNVTHDHLDYHKTIEDYRAAKREFCESLTAPDRVKPSGTLVYSGDDPVSREIGEKFPAEKIVVRTSESYQGLGEEDAGDGPAGRRVSAYDVSATLSGTVFKLRFEGGTTGSGGATSVYETPVAMKLLGSYCAVNAALAAAAAGASGVPVDAIRAGLEALERVPGRFEALGGAGKPVVIIDYSHTPDSMARVLDTCRGLNPGRLVTVFGCGGDRDRLKRPEMGRVAQAKSDFVYVTMDNPRTEPIETIVEDILSGMDLDAGNHTVDLDRARAIHHAIAGARAGDVVALLGKGVENYQIVGDERLPFSDHDEAQGALREWTAQ